MILKSGGSLRMKIREDGGNPPELVMSVADKEGKEPDVVVLKGSEVARLIDAVSKPYAAVISRGPDGRVLLEFDTSVEDGDNVSFAYNLWSFENGVKLNEPEAELFLAGIASLAWRLWT